MAAILAPNPGDFKLRASPVLPPVPTPTDNAAMKLPRFQFRLRTLMIGVTLFCAAVWMATIGVSFWMAEVVAWTTIACVPFLIVVRSAYRDACRRQRWPGKNRETHTASW